MFNKIRPPHLIRGEKSEQLACHYLLNQGLQLIESNFLNQLLFYYTNVTYVKWDSFMDDTSTTD